MENFKIFKSMLSIFLVVLICSFVSCKDDKDEILSNAKELTRFTMQLGDAAVEGTQTEDGVIVFKITPDLDMEHLKSATPRFFISPRAIVTPLPSVPQDFSTDVKYTVIAQDGSTKDWTIKWTYGELLPEGEGFGYNYCKWEKSAAEMGLSANVENSIAVCGDYLVVSRTGLMFNKFTGEPAGTLNMTGISGATNKVPFFLTNDDKGNLIGCTLGAWDNNNFHIYKWTSVNAAPIEIGVLLNTTDSKAGSAGRKLTVVGDINGTAHIVAMIANNTLGQHFLWKVTNGVVDPNYTFVTTKLANGMLQNVSPMDRSTLYPLYIAGTTTGSTGAGIFLMENENSTPVSVPGPVTDIDKGTYGWGNHSHINIKSFTFNGRKYTAVAHSCWQRSLLSVIDCVDANRVVATRTVYTGGTGGNGNATGSLTLELSEDGQELYLYSLVSSLRVGCYVFTKYEK